MTYTEEKITYGIAALTASAASTLGAMMTDGESRWFFVTITSSILTACFLALVFKRSDEGIRLVIGRAGLSILGGVLASRFVVDRFGLSVVHNDIVALAGVAAAVTIACFVIGYPLLQLINSKSGSIADRIFKKWMP
jgi:hypothetical protein